MILFVQPNFTEIGEYCNSVRDFEDMQDSWDKVLFILDWFASMQDILANASGPGRYNDADFVSGYRLHLKYTVYNMLFMETTFKTNKS